MPVRKILFTLLAAGFASLALADDKRIPLDTGDSITLSWRESWVVGAMPPGSPEVAGALVFHGPDVNKWRATIVPLPPHPTLTGDVGNLRIYVRNLARALENSGSTVDHEQKALTGGRASGFYVRAHDPKAGTRKTNLPDFSEGYVGAIKVGTKPYLFEVFWNAGGEADANAALAALKTLRMP
jgi:hypothetical protein